MDGAFALAFGIFHQAALFPLLFCSVKIYLAASFCNIDIENQRTARECDIILQYSLSLGISMTVNIHKQYELLEEFYTWECFMLTKSGTDSANRR